MLRVYACVDTNGHILRKQMFHANCRLYVGPACVNGAVCVTTSQSRCQNQHTPITFTHKHTHTHTHTHTHALSGASRAATPVHGAHGLAAIRPSSCQTDQLLCRGCRCPQAALLRRCLLACLLAWHEAALFYMQGLLLPCMKPPFFICRACSLPCMKPPFFICRACSCLV